MMSFISESLMSLSPTQSLLIAGAVGFIAYPIIKRISKVAIAIFSSCREWISTRTFMIRLHSLVCDECARNHKRHMYEAPHSSPQLTPK